MRSLCALFTLAACAPAETQMTARDIPVINIPPPPPPSADERDREPLSDEWRLATSVPRRHRCRFYTMTRAADGVETRIPLADAIRDGIAHYDPAFTCNPH